MNLTLVNQTLEELSAERGQIHGELEALKEKLHALQKRLDYIADAELSLRNVLGQPSDERQVAMEFMKKERPRTIDAVYLALRERPHTAMSAGSIMDKLLEADLLDPDLKQPYGTVLDAARRLAGSRDEIVRSKRNGKVRFSFHPEKLADRDPPGDARKGDILGIPRPGEE